MIAAYNKRATGEKYLINRTAAEPSRSHRSVDTAEESP